MAIDLSVRVAGPKYVFVTLTPKGGAGKTETADVLEGMLTAGGYRVALLDVDDGNRGLTRRVGKTETVQVPWDKMASQAPAWVQGLAPSYDALIFDLGAGIESADMPIFRFLLTAWQILRSAGAKIVICAVVSTNAPTSNFIGRAVESYGAWGEVLIVRNNQDGSMRFSPELAGRPEPQLLLEQLPAGVQAYRLTRQERLSAVIASPSVGFEIATAMLADRVHKLALQPQLRGIIGLSGLERLRHFAAEGQKSLKFVVSDPSFATDAALLLNHEAWAAYKALLVPGLEGEPLMLAAARFRSATLGWRDHVRAMTL